MSSGEKNVLIPHDGSRLAGRVVDVAAAALGSDCHVTLAHVQTPGSSEAAGVDTTAQDLARDGIRVTRRDAQAADAAAEIIDIIEHSAPDLVLMGTHGRSGAGQFIRGSVAERVLRGCPAPLLMVDPASETPMSPGSVLVPLDASDQSFEIIPPLLQLLAGSDALIALLFVDYDDATDTAELREKRREQRQSDVADWFRKTEEQIAAAGLRSTVLVKHGIAAEQILELANAPEYDLLAMTTHGRSGLTRWAFGSVAEKVLSACTKPVLLKRVS